MAASINSSNLFVEGGLITWRVANPIRNQGLTIEFFLFGDLGQRTENLKDIIIAKLKVTMPRWRLISEPAGNGRPTMRTLWPRLATLGRMQAVDDHTRVR
jgi:hypothetical protein